MAGADDVATMPDHSHHGDAEAPRHNRSRMRWAIAYVVGLVLVTAILFVLVPGGGQLGLFVLLGGLMVLHHLPGAHQHGG